MGKISERSPLTWVAFSPDSRRFLSGGWAWAVRLWDASSGELCERSRVINIVSLE